MPAKLDFKYEYMIAMLMAIGIDGKAFERKNIMEFMPKQYASEIRDGLVVIRTPTSTPEQDESAGARIVHQRYATLRRSRTCMHVEFQIDIWLKDIANEILEATLSDQAENYIGLNDHIKTPNGDTITVEYLGAGIVEDENDDFYKVVIRLKFIEPKYKDEHVPLLTDENQVQIEVST